VLLMRVERQALWLGVVYMSGEAGYALFTRMEGQSDVERCPRELRAGGWVLGAVYMSGEAGWALFTRAEEQGGVGCR